MKSHYKLALSASMLALTVPMTAEAEVLVAGWHRFNAEPERNSAPNVSLADTVVTMSGTGNWNDWNGGGTLDGASPDDTYGNLSTSVAAAPIFIGTGSSQNTNLSLGRNDKPGTLVFTLVNNTGSDQVFEAFYFDGMRRFAQSATDWSLSFSSAISGTAAEGTFIRDDDGMSGSTAIERDKKIDLSSLTDNIWEAGSTAVFTLSVGGGLASTGTSNGGHETLLDNIGITIVPEPTSLALLGLGSLLIARRRRD